MPASLSASLRSALYKGISEPLTNEQNSLQTSDIYPKSRFTRSSISALFGRQDAYLHQASDRENFVKARSNTAIEGRSNRSQRRPASKKGGRKLFINPNQRLSGSLSETDKRNSERNGRFADDFVLKGVQAGQWVTVSLNSNSFDAYLQLINTATGRVIAHNDYVELGNDNSKLGFVAQAGVNYQLRITSYGSGETGRYTLITRTFPEILPNTYTYDYGYGLINAAAAVAHAIGQPAFTDVADLGGVSWGLDMVKAPEVWAQGFTGQGITVAVLDTGVDYNHSDLKDNIWTNTDEIAGNGVDDDSNGFIDDFYGWNFADGGNSDPMDFDSHGTHVSGTIAAVNNGFGTTGVAYGAKIMPVKVIGREDVYISEFDANVAAGIRYAVQNGAKVINMSLGNNPDEPPMPQTQAALQYAKQAGVIAVMAAGNEKRDFGAIEPIQPASYAVNHLGIAVGAVNIRKQVADFSNPAGNRPLDFVVAPGVNVYSTIPGNDYTSYRGTSMATPHVTGVAALLLSANPTLTADQISTILIATASGNGVTVL